MIWRGSLVAEAVLPEIMAPDREPLRGERQRHRDRAIKFEIRYSSVLCFGEERR